MGSGFEGLERNAARIMNRLSSFSDSDFRQFVGHGRAWAVGPRACGENYVRLET